jgi:hypothetical protein
VTRSLQSAVLRTIEVARDLIARTTTATDQGDCAMMGNVA